MTVYGLRVYDSQGNVVLDVTDRVPRILGSFKTPTITSTGTYKGDVQHGGLGGRTAIWWLELAKPASSVHQYDYRIHQEGEKLHWEIKVKYLLPGGQLPPMLVHYGVY
ncbi:hypothetical protein [Salinivibrio kushneri]|uniref:Uncharacterized protein n=1 Tax=Salinivibrio kushneri TaxID=1908198 RepID=A0AB36K5L6_9GAMM|nr:hypothetical protein [Salinivibrio kushneri]OOE43440.1 hypothetical protein BZG09_10695 [Salinivibrio kushneri]